MEQLQFDLGSAANFRKADPPPIGPITNARAFGSDILQMPGGATLMFDLDKLGLPDFRAMRYHPQVNASLTLIMFTLHQLDWHIECEEKKIADAVEENLRLIWTRLIRALSQSFWAGYSPCVLEWENTTDGKYIFVNKVIDLMPEECQVHWKEVPPAYRPRSTSGVSHIPPKVKIYDGISKFGLNYPLPPELCVHPETPILCADMVWRPAGELNIGQEIIAFDEDAGPMGRKFCRAQIVVNNRGTKDGLRITTDIGEPIEASLDHPFLVRMKLPSSKIGWGWRDASDLVPGDQIAFFGNTWEFDESREAGWIAGMFDGEGCLSGGQLTISQKNGVVLDHLKGLLASKGFTFSVSHNLRDSVQQLVLVGGRKEIMRFLGTFRPMRLMARSAELMDGVYIKGDKSVQLATVESVDRLGVIPVASIQTSCGTFITNGYLSHNTLWYPLMMENGDHYGRKLLKAAFQPWYFSMVVHIFANRYFERFGEPTPIGRAPFDDEFNYTDAAGVKRTKTGKQAMEEILLSLRSRNQVVLPSERDPTASSGGGRSEYLWDIEYLESQMRGADFERYLARLDEEISLSIFTPMLLMRSGDVGSHNLGVQHTQCVDPSTPILCADLVWRPAGELKAGQEIVAFDEDGDSGQGRGVNARAFRTATIVGNAPSAKPSMRITTDIGEPVTASVDHPWLVWRNRTGAYRTKGLVWVETRDLRVGDQIAHFSRPWQRETSFEAGWVSGMFDGEGCMSIKDDNRNRGGNSQSSEICFVQVDGPVMDKMKRLLGEFGVQASITSSGSSSLGSKPQSRLRIGGGFLGAIEFVGRFAPERFIARAPELWEGKGVRRNQSYELATVTSIEDVGMNPVASIRTSTGTFITGGYLTHNTWLWNLNALAGDIKEYIDRYLCERIKAYNFSEKAPKVEWVPRRLGKDNPETIRTMVNALISGNHAKPDITEMGVALGMKLNEIREATEDPNANPQDTRGPRPERNRSGSGPRRVGEPLATGREIAARVGPQVTNAWNDLPNANLSMGFRRRFAESLVAEGCTHEDAQALTEQVYGNMNNWLKTVTALGPDEFSSPQDFMALFNRKLTQEIENLAAR